MTEVLTLERVRAAAREVMERNPKLVYNPSGRGSCFYAPIPELPKGKYGNGYGIDSDDIRNTTGCIVGELLKLEGLMNDRIFERGEPILYLIDQGLVLVENESVKHYLFTLQEGQDRGHTWEMAFRAAESTLSE